MVLMTFCPVGEDQSKASSEQTVLVVATTTPAARMRAIVASSASECTLPLASTTACRPRTTHLCFMILLVVLPCTWHDRCLPVVAQDEDPTVVGANSIGQDEQRERELLVAEENLSQHLEVSC